MKLDSIATLIVILLSPSVAVDRSNFKNCAESSFCKRNRALTPGESAFSVVQDTVKISGNEVSGRIVNRKNEKAFKLLLKSYKNCTIQIQVDEAEPLRQRFRPSDTVLDENLVPLNFEVVKKDAAFLKVRTAEKNRFVLNFAPFRLDVYTGEDIVMSLNSQGLMNFEHYRTKAEKPKEDAEPSPDPEEPPPEGEETTEPPQTEETGDEEGMWEESFKSHHDSKPYGPSSVGLDVSFIGFTHLYGIPEHAHSFKLQTTTDGQPYRLYNLDVANYELHSAMALYGSVPYVMAQTDSEPYRLYNLDVFEYELNSHMALYGAVPYVTAFSRDRTVGFLWLNPSETWIDVKSNTADKGFLASMVDKLKSAEETPQIDTHWFSESGLIDMYLFLGPKPKDVFAQYTHYTGVTPLPPLWSLAYHQCRWNYNDREDVRTVHDNFDRFDIPMDVIWLDIEHTNGKRYFTWDQHKFPDPKGMIESMSAKGRKMITIVDPHIKKDDGYKVYKDAKDLQYFTKTKDDHEYDGWCWPGSSGYLDFLNPAVQKYWADMYSLENYVGSTNDLYIWNDMNEPSVFNGPEITMHKDAKHFGGWEHRDVHNVYGFYHHRSTFQGLQARSGHTLRPFVLTRAFFVGSQRYGAVWTGDNTANWNHLKISIPMLLSLSVAGIPFVGADVGGFFNNPDEELLARWYQMGAFSPFFRAHAHLDTKRREPWLFSNETMMSIRESIRIRYKMLPYWYTQFYEHTKTGLPVMRPLWLEFPHDRYAPDEEKEFMIGDTFLVRPVTESAVKSVSVYLPQEGAVWYDYDTHRPQPAPGAVWVETPLTKMPVFIRGGTIFATKERVRRASTLMSHDPYTIYVALDYPGKSANGTLYVDDFKSYEYQNGRYIYRRLTYEGDAYTARIKSTNIAEKSASFVTDAWVEKIVVMGMRWYPEQTQIMYGGGGMILKHKFEGKRMRLEVRKPGVKIGQDWELVITS